MSTRGTEGTHFLAPRKAAWQILVLDADLYWFGPHYWTRATLRAAGFGEALDALIRSGAIIPDRPRATVDPPTPPRPDWDTEPEPEAEADTEPEPEAEAEADPEPPYGRADP